MNTRPRQQASTQSKAAQAKAAPTRKSRSRDNYTSERSSKATPVFQTLAQIPRGHVATYGQIATLAGMPGAARYVGYCLRNLPDGSTLPWHRVVASGGRIALVEGSDAYVLQQNKLGAEGIDVINGKIDMKRYQWRS